MDPNLLYERPFTDLHEQGLDGLFSNQVVELLLGINQVVT
jgi:hypothetical protein